MKKQRKHPDPLLRSKNIMRGVSNRSDKEAWSALDHVRAELNPNRYREFAEWLRHGHPSLSSCIALSPVRSWNRLIPLRLTRNVDLIRELAWTDAILKGHYDRLSTFYSMLQKLNESVIRQDAISLEILDEIDRLYGCSLWALELRIALLQIIRGIEAQKEFVNEMRSEANLYIPFFSYWFSKRNEPATKLSNYSRNVNKIIGTAKNHSVFQLDYLIFKLKKFLPDGNERLSAVLRIELSTSIIDVYETFLAVCEKSLSESTDQKFNDYVIGLLTGMLTIGDSRIAKLIDIFGTGNEVIKENILCRPRNISPDNLFMIGKYKEAFLSATSSLRSNPMDPSMMDTCARILACLEDNKDVEQDFPGEELVTHLSTVYLKGPGWKDSFHYLLKTSMNLSSLCVYTNLVSFAMRDPFRGRIDLREIERSLLINSPYLEPYEFRICADGYKTFFRKNCSSVYEGSAKLKYEIIIDEGILEGHTESSLSLEMQLVAQIHNYLERQCYEQAYALSRQLIPSRLDYFAREGSLLAIFALYKMDKLQDMITEIVRGCLRQEEFRYALSLQTILGQLSWNELREFAGTIELPIVLNLYLSDHEDDRHRTNLRYAFEEFLLKQNIAKPSELRDRLDEFRLEEVVYFLRRIAKQDIMDICLTFNSSRELDEERLKVCSVLIEIDPAHKEIYESELFDLTKRIRIREGLLLVDKSRVFVDTSALDRWSERELRELYNRYRELAPLKMMHSATDLKTALREYLKHQEPLPEQFLKVPDNEGDDLLIQMVIAVVEAFFRNPEFGFEFYLSTRVRHGSLSGHLRGPLEEHHLITFKDEKTKQYRPIEYWFEKVPYLEDLQRSAMTDAFLTFSKEYDEIIEHLTQDHLQVRSTSKPSGVFNPTIMPVVSLHVLKDLAQGADTTFEKFVAACVATSWGLLKDNLTTLRTLLNEQIKLNLLKLLTNLTSRLRQILDAHQYIPLGTEISIAQTEVQSVLDRVAAWFLLPERGTSDVYTLEQAIDIGIEFTKNARRGFTPNIECNIISNVHFLASGLARVVDCIFIMLDNVYRHSGIMEDPHVYLLVELLELQGGPRVLRIRMESEIASGTRSPDQEEKIDRIIHTIKNGDYKTQVKAEGGSGLIKLNRMAVTSDSFTFGFRNDDQFYVEVCIPFLVLERTIEKT